MFYHKLTILLFNMSIRSGRVPSKWKMSSVVSIPKSATGTDNPSNYRPNSLLSVASNLLEKHINSIEFEHPAGRELLSVDQWGFCPGKSQSLVSLQHFITFFNYQRLVLTSPLFSSTCVRPLIVFTIYLSCRNEKILISTSTSCSGFPLTYVVGSNMLW